MQGGLSWLKNKKFLRVIFSLLLILFISNGFFSNALHSNQEGALNYLSNVVFNGYAYALGGKIGSEFSQLISYNDESGLYQIKVSSNIYNFSLEMDHNLRLKYSEWTTKNKNLIKLLGHDKRITLHDCETQKTIIQYYLGNRLKETKMFAYDEDTIDSDMINIYLQKKLAEGIQVFNCNVLLKARGLKLNVRFHRETVKDLIGFSQEYNFPEKFREFSNHFVQDNNEVYVYVMELTGIFKLFYPYKYYTAFTKSSPHRLVAYWGGAPRDADFIFIETVNETN